MAVEFQVLGDVVARVDGRVVPIGHARQRCVLVALLIDANRPVSADQLVDRVWADQLPQRARATLRGYLSRLRQILAGTGEVRILHQPGGYLLSVDLAALDVHRFHRLVADARACDEPRQAVYVYEQALALWRGEAFARLDTPWLNSVRASLDAAKFAAELDRNDAALAAGRHAELLTDLTTGAAAHPLDERLAGQFLLALYRCGRQAEALRRYEHFRRDLAEELGADPSPPLRQLHQQILAGDQALATPTGPTRAMPTPVPAPSPAPRQMPTPPRSFTGRAHELAALDAVADATSGTRTTVISAVSGTAGVGKTALVVQWAHRVAEKFPDGQLYVNLRGFDPSGFIMEPAEAIRSFLDALAVPPQRIPSGQEAQVALYRSLLSTKRMLIVLDNARDVEQIRPLLPGNPGCMVVVTSRNQLTGLIMAEGAHSLTVELFSTGEARDLLAGRLGTVRVAAEPEAVDAIISRCAGLPLALTIVAARATIHPDYRLAELAAELVVARGDLDAFYAGDLATDVQAVFSWSYHILGAETARLFRLLALHPGRDIGVAAAASLAGLPRARARSLLAELATVNLVSEPSPGRYTFHDLLRGYAQRLVHGQDAPSRRRAATYRMLDHYLHTAHTAAMRLHPYRDPIALAPPQPQVAPERPADYRRALAWFTAEHQALLAAIDHAAGTGFDAHAWQLTWTMWTFLDRQGHWPDMVAVGQVAVAASGRLADPTPQALSHRFLGCAACRLRRYDDAHAHLHRALDLYRQAGDLSGQGHAHNNLCNMYEGQGRYQAALDHAEHSLDLYRAAGHRRGHAHGLNTVGWYHALLGNYQRAVVACRHALGPLGDLDDRAGQAMTWHSLGYAYHHLGDRQQAGTAYRRALDLFREVGDRFLEADTLARLGDSHHAAGDPALAREEWRHALTILDELDHPDTDRLRAKLRRVNLVPAADT